MAEARAKPRVRIKGTPTARYMAHDRSGVLSMRRAVTRDVKHDVRQAAQRSFALAFDFMQNSGWVAGAADQVISDMIGTELKLNCRPDLAGLGYDDKERSDWCRLVEKEWRRWSRNPAECDLEGKATIAETLDGVARYYLAGGEALGVLDFLTARQRQGYGIETGTKVRLVAPHRLTQHTSPVEGWEQGIYHDEIGRPQFYRFTQTRGGMDQGVDIPARTGGVAKVVHVMDRGATPNSPRGISPMTPAFKTVAQSDQLADATLTTALLQTAFAATIQSPEPSDSAFEALETLRESDFEGAAEVAGDLFDVWYQRLEALKSKSLSIGGDASQVNHLGPGEDLKLHSSNTPGPQYREFQHSLLREFARCLGVTFESLVMDHSSASYASVKMAHASVWPIVVRRRERIVSPFAQAVFEAWLDEEIATGRIPFKGGYRAFVANRRKVVDAEWRGPHRPSADPFRDAQANKVELEAGTTTLQRIYAAKGLDWEEELDQVAREAERFEAIGVKSPYGRMAGGDAGPMGGAADGMREPANGG